MGGLARMPYYQRIQSVNGLLRYWPINEASGTTVTDISTAKNNIASGYSSVTLAQPGIGDSNTCGLWTNPGSYASVYSAALAAAQPGNEGTLAVWVKASDVAIWNDTVTLTILRYRCAGGNEYIGLYKYGTGYVAAVYRAAGVSRTFTQRQKAGGWLLLTLAWSNAGNLVTFDVNGIQVSAAQASPGAWGDTVTGVYVGAQTDGSSASNWSGWLAHAMLFNRALTQLERRNLFDWRQPGKRLTVIGDSISSAAVNTDWPVVIANTYNSGVCGYWTHAVSGNTIMSHFDTQTAEAANDQASVIICELGTNDDNAGDMGALQAKVESNLAALRSSNAGAPIYYMNVLPRWTDTGGGTPVDKGNIRTAIAAACTAQGVTCWDTFTTPWITAAQTADGLHPTAAGDAAIAAEVLARI